MNCKRFVLAVLLGALLLGLAACGAQPAAQPEPTPEPTAQPEPTPAPTPTPQPEPTPTPEPTPDPNTPAGRAAAKNLPEPPDVDIDSWEFRLANSNNGIAVAYRNFDFLFYMYRYMINQLGSAAAVAAVWPGPGTSEHQLGLALDFTDSYAYSAYYEYFDNTGFRDTELYQWLHEHCAEYGFIDRYPDGKEYYYGTACTEGHFRYVGEEAARYIMDNDICFEEFLMLYDPDRVFIPGAD